MNSTRPVILLIGQEISLQCCKLLMVLGGKMEEGFLRFAGRRNNALRIVSIMSLASERRQLDSVVIPPSVS